VARLRDTTVEAVRQAADLVAVVEERTALRKAGARMMGRCPFHDERTPSFSVSPAKGMYYCFGCGKGGDVFTFVEETQGLDFTSAVEWLAERFRITPEYEQSVPGEEASRRRRKQLYELLDQAASFYERLLWDSQAGSYARDYLAGRGLREEACREFRLGLAPGGGLLTRKAVEKGFTAQELREAGLSRQRGDDYFQRRLLFPLADARGRVVGFQARRLHDDDPLHGKYVNTPESELFVKGAVVYGLDKARDAIAKEDRACVVEGNTDVIALRQSGFNPVVACMGTALTDAQLRELGRLTKRLWLAFDGDAAGATATLRGMEAAVAQGFDVKVVALPPGVDPADDPTGFETHLASAKPYVRYRTEVEAARGGYQAAVGFLQAVPDSPVKRDAIAWLSDRFGMTPQLPSVRGTVESFSPKRLAARDRLERDALAGVVAHPSLTPILAELPQQHFHDDLSRAVRSHLVDGTPLEGQAVALLAELDARADSEGIDKQTAEELLLRLRERELRAELLQAAPEQLKELQDRLVRVREGLAALAGVAPEEGRGRA
jgi:DNA primase catalytic core